MAIDGMPADAPTENASGGMSPTMSPASSSRSTRVSLAARLTRSVWNAQARRIESASSSVRLSLCTTPVSVSMLLKWIRPLTIRSKSHRGADVRTPMRVSGRLASTALMTSTMREAWPYPCPEM